MSSNAPEGRGEFYSEFDFDEEALLSTMFEENPPSPCELLEPVMHGIMAKELADMVLPGKEVSGA